MLPEPLPSNVRADTQQDDLISLSFFQNNENMLIKMYPWEGPFTLTVPLTPVTINQWAYIMAVFTHMSPFLPID
jgi:hypothetical protein